MSNISSCPEARSCGDSTRVVRSPWTRVSVLEVFDRRGRKAVTLPLKHASSPCEVVTDSCRVEFEGHPALTALAPANLSYTADR